MTRKRTIKKMKNKLLLVGFCFFSSAVWATDLVKLDSIGLERKGDKTFIIHQVAPQETLFSISRRYNTPVSDIVQNNEVLKDGLKIGQRILVPFIEKQTVPDGALLYHVQPGETLFSIAKKHDLGVQDVMEWNGLQGTDLSVGQALILKGVAEERSQVSEEMKEGSIVPADQNIAQADDKGAENKQPGSKIKAEEKKVNSGEAQHGERNAASEFRNQSASSASLPVTSSIGGWKSHTVAQGETLFSVAQAYQAKVEDLISWNGLSSNNLSIGQTLKVGRETGASIPVTRYPTPERSTEPSGTPTQTNSSTTVATAPSPTTGNQNSSTAYKDIKETGQAEVIEGTGNHKKYLVLHRDAPVGTIMRIRNEENDVTIFARVVGALPNTGDNNKLIVKVSKAAFDQLRAVNSRFPVEVSY